MTDAPDFPYEALAKPGFSLAGKRALVTGAGGHLGAEVSRGLANAGAEVLLVGRSRDKLAPVRDEIRAAGGQANIASLDLFDLEATAAFASEIAEGEAPLDILVNNAYSGPTNTLMASTASDYENSYRIAVVAAAELVKGLVPAFRRAVAARGDAAVVNMASMYGHVSPDPRIYGDSGQNSPPYYSASKAGLIHYTTYAAVHLAPERIRVNAVSPGPFPPLRFRDEKPDFYRELTAKVPLGRIGVAADLVGPVVFLASPAAQYVTGVNLPVDGGWTSW